MRGSMLGGVKKHGSTASTDSALLRFDKPEGCEGLLHSQQAQATLGRAAISVSLLALQAMLADRLLGVVGTGQNSLRGALWFSGGRPLLEALA